MFRFVLSRTLKKTVWLGFRVFFLKILLSFVSDNTILRIIDKLSKQYSKCDESRYIGCVSEYIPEIYESKLFEKRIQLEFEHYKFWAPQEYDNILKICYGNYMKLPSEDKREVHYIDAYQK